MIFGVPLSWVMLFELATMFTEYVIVFLFFNSFLGQQNSNRLKNILFSLVYVISITLINVIFFGNDAVTMPFSLLIYILIALFLFDGNLALKILAGFLFAAFMFIVDLFVIFGLMWVVDISAQYIFDVRGLSMIYGAIISRVLLLLITKIVGNLRNKENKLISIEYWVAIVTFPVISIFIIYMMFEFNWRLQEAYVTGTTVLALLGVLYINIFAFNLIEFFANKTVRDTKSIILEQSFDKQVKECQRLDFLIESRSKFFHEMKHYSPTLERLVAENDIAGAMDIFKKLLELEAIQTQEHVWTSNNVVNALFNYYIANAKDKGIAIDVSDLFLPEEMNIDVADLCSIFGNSLENAIEACERMTDGEKFIAVGLRYRNGKLTYKITNSTNGKLMKKKKRFASSKNTFGLNGFGIEIMENSVEKYNGVFRARHNPGNIFEVAFSTSVSF